MVKRTAPPNRKFQQFVFNENARPQNELGRPPETNPARLLNAKNAASPAKLSQTGDPSDATFLEALRYWFPSSAKDPDHFVNKISGFDAVAMHTMNMIVIELYERSTMSELTDLITIHLVSSAKEGRNAITGEFDAEVEIAIDDLLTMRSQKNDFSQMQFIWQMTPLAKIVFQSTILASLDIALTTVVDNSALAPTKAAVEKTGFFIFNACSHGGMDDPLLRKTAAMFNDLAEITGSNVRLNVNADGDLSVSNNSQNPPGRKPGSSRGPGLN